MNRNKNVGTAAETASARFLQSMGWPHAERRALSGRVDRGDLAGVIGVTWQIKAVAKPQYTKWFEEVVQQAENDNNSLPVLVHKIKYKNVAQWDAFLQVDWLMEAQHFGKYEFARVEFGMACRILQARGY